VFASLRAMAALALAPAAFVIPPRATRNPSLGCAAAEHRQFDFWLGAWEVRRPDGRLAGTNRITRILGGCVLEEHWTGAGGSRGTSVNIYDGGRHRWHQTWVDDEGLLLQLDGGLVGNRMELTGETVGDDGKPVRQRITWEPLDGGRVRQLWETSADAGATWSVAFDGIYTRIHR
jgi:hypothetical protein